MRGNRIVPTYANSPQCTALRSECGPITSRIQATPTVQEEERPLTLTSTSDEALPSVETQIKFEDTTSVLEQRSQNMFERLYSQINPFPDETPTGQLEKTVYLFDLIWNSTGISSTGTGTHQTFDPIIQLQGASPWITNILGTINVTTGMYRYFRTDLKIICKMNSTPYHQGCGYIAWLPQPIGQTLLSNPAFALGLHPVLFEASNQDEFSITMPYISAYPHIDFTAYSGIWWVCIAVLNPLLSSNSAISDNVTLSVYAKFENPKLYGPIQSGATPFKQRRNLRNFVQQSATDHKKNRPNKEAQKKDLVGITAQAVAPVVKPILESVPFLAPIMSFGKALLDSLDKPTTDSPVQLYVQREMRCINHLTGIDTAESLGSLPQAAVATDVGFDNSSMTVAQYAQIPQYMQTYTFSAAGYVGRIPVHPQYFQQTNPDYLGFASSMYVYWRGSIKYLFHFVGTAFYSARVRLSLVYEANPPASALNDVTPYTQKVIDVKGSTWTSFSVPYLGPTTWAPITTSSTWTRALPYIYIEVLTPVFGSSLPSTAIYYLNVYRAGGSDIQFAQLRTAQIQQNTEKSFLQQTSLRNKFAEAFEGITPGITGTIEEGLHQADTATTIADACHRYVDLNLNFTGQYHYTYPGEQPTTTGVNLLQPFHFWSFGFAFWRGSRRLKIINAASTPITVSLTDSWNVFAAGASGGQGSGRMYQDSLVNSAATISVEVPYYSAGAYYGTYACGPPSITILNFPQPTDAKPNFTLATNYQALLAAGDDFRYIFPIPYWGQITAQSPPTEVTRLSTVSARSTRVTVPESDIPTGSECT